MEPADYPEYPIAPIDDLDALDVDDLAVIILDAVDVEGPMNLERLARLLADASQFPVLAERHKARLTKAISELRRSNELVVAGNGDGVDSWVMSAPDQPAVLPRKLGPRTAEQVPWNELPYHAELPAVPKKEAVDAPAIPVSQAGAGVVRRGASPSVQSRLLSRSLSGWRPGSEAAEAFDRWNEQIGRTFFDGSHKNRPVYLDLESDVLDSICEDLGEPRPGRAALLEVVRGTLPPADEGLPLFDYHLARAGAWERDGALGLPPFTALLGAFVVTAEDMCGDGEFAANNYYGRLTANLGLDPDCKKRVEREYRDHASQLWGVLNGWLRDQNGTLGIPTAFAFDCHRYINLPMSQALVREHDRRKLTGFFVASDLAPGQRATAEDIEPLFAAWLSRSSISSSLKTLWQSNSAARERISSVVAGELEAWDGSIEAASLAEMDIRIRMALSLQSFPWETVELAAVVSAATSPEGRYLPLPDTPEDVLAVLKGCSGELRASRGRLEGWLLLDDAGAGCAPLMLNGALSLDCEGRPARRPIRRLVVLEFDEMNRVYVEADRAHLGVESALLVHDSLWQSRRSEIEKVLRPGFRLVPCNAGVPSGWTLIVDAQVVGVAADDADLESLVPLSLIQLACSGGLKLPGRGGWHVDAPPEVLAACLLEEEFSLSLVADRTGERHELGIFVGATVVSLGELSLVPGDYFLLASDGKDVIAHRTVSLRMSDTGVNFDNPVSAYDLSTPDPLALLGSRPLEELDACSLIGSLLDADSVAHEGGDLPALPTRSGRCWSDAPGDEVLVARAQAAMGFQPPECLLTGGHYWSVARVEPGHTAPSQPAVCRLCGSKRIFRPMRNRRHAERLKAVQTAPPEIPSVGGREEGRVSVESVFDAVMFAGSGSLPVLKALCSAACEDAGFSMDAIRSMAAIGYIDLVRRDESELPQAFSTPTPSVVLPASGEPFLTGRVCRDVIDWAEIVAAEHGAVLEKRVDPLGIPIWHVVGLTEERARGFVDECGVELSMRPGERLAAALPGLRAVKGSLKSTRIGRAGLSRFDYSANKWMQVDEADLSGAYKQQRYGSTYAVRLADTPPGFGLLCDNSTAKYLAAPGVDSMLWFEPEGNELLCRLGAPLPTLLERALFFDSGVRPTKHKDGTYRYHKVSERMARHVRRIVEGGSL